MEQPTIKNPHEQLAEPITMSNSNRNASEFYQLINNLVNKNHEEKIDNNDEHSVENPQLCEFIIPI